MEMNPDLVLKGLGFMAVVFWLVLFVRSFVDHHDRPSEPEAE